MEGITRIIAAVVLTRAIFTDIKKGRIENGLMGAGMTTGFLLAGIRGGRAGLWNSLTMALLILLVLFMLFILKGLGAGDIKLLCVMAVFFPKNAVMIVVGAFFVSALWAVKRMVVRRLRKEPFYIRRETINFSIPVALSTLVSVGMGW